MFSKIFKEIPYYVGLDDYGIMFIFKFSGGVYKVVFRGGDYTVETIKGKTRSKKVAHLFERLMQKELNRYIEYIEGARANLKGISKHLFDKSNKAASNLSIYGGSNPYNEVLERMCRTYLKLLSELRVQETKYEELLETSRAFASALIRTGNVEKVSKSHYSDCIPSWKCHKIRIGNSMMDVVDLWFESFSEGELDED